jgi:hypothetical protein
MVSKKIKRIEVFLEFLLFGVAMGIIEDVIAIKLSTGETITWHMIGIITLVAIPFAFIGEYLVDHKDLISHPKK